MVNVSVRNKTNFAFLKDSMTITKEQKNIINCKWN